LKGRKVNSDFTPVILRQAPQPIPDWLNSARGAIKNNGYLPQSSTSHKALSKELYHKKYIPQGLFSAPIFFFDVEGSHRNANPSTCWEFVFSAGPYSELTNAFALGVIVSSDNAMN
jgi:hypothetical protein